MKTFTPPHTTLEASNVILGLMRISQLDDAAIRSLVSAARDSGINYFDHADVYGGNHGCERRFGDAFRVATSRGDPTDARPAIGNLAYKLPLSLDVENRFVRF